MKRFQSRIESLRRIREQADKLARLQAAVRHREKERADQVVKTAQQRIAQLTAINRDTLSTGRPELLQTLLGTTARLQAECQQAGMAAHTAQHHLSDAVRHVAAAQTRLRIAESYIENEYAQYRRNCLTEEEHLRQENSAQRHRRRAGREPGANQGKPLATEDTEVTT